MSNIKVGDLVILKGQRKGRFQLEGGYVIRIDGVAVVLHDGRVMYAWPLEDVELFTEEYKTPKGNEIVAAKVGDN